MVPNARFTEFLADIEPSPSTKKESSAAHTGLRDFLRLHDTFGDRYESSFLAGSSARDTAIRPQRSNDQVERSDLDIVFETNFEERDTPDAVLNEVADVLVGGGYELLRINKRSVRIKTWSAIIDVVPVIPSGSQHKIVDRDLGGWKLTDPRGHIDWSRDKNDAFGGRFKPLVKMQKWWRRVNPTSSKRPKGFILEVLTALHAPRDETHYGEAFAQLMENVYATYGRDVETGFKPYIEDPCIPGSDILSKVADGAWQSFIDKVRVYASIARDAQNEEDMEEATRLWRKVFGGRFPATENAAKATVLSGTATAPAIASIGAAGGYTFPNAQAAPTKPRGFA